MMTLVSLILLAIAAVHALWGLRIWFPIRDEEKLALAVVGARGATRMPGTIPCFLVVVALMLLVAAIWMPDWMIRTLILSLAIAAFLLRGVIAYTKLWRRMTPEEPFATCDRRYYAPLCLALGVGLILILIGET